VGIVRQSRSVGDDPVSPLEQRQRIETTGAREGFDLLDTLPEKDVSGGAPLDKRPGLSQAVAMDEGGHAQVIVVAYFDRLFRSLEVQADVAKRVEAAAGMLFAADVGEGPLRHGFWLDHVVHARRGCGVPPRTTRERTTEAKRRSVANGLPRSNRSTSAGVKSRSGQRNKLGFPLATFGEEKVAYAEARAADEDRGRGLLGPSTRRSQARS
jgi:hypothetical protein